MEEWRPGSFTKNFSWGPLGGGLRQLQEMIRVGFAGELKDTPRALFRERVARIGPPDYIALNFFLFNKIIDNTDYIIADELVFQALNSSHSTRFDKLALFAFNFSYVGQWKGADRYQRRPALWAYHYINDRLRLIYGWNTKKISADDIERFVAGDQRYKAQTSRKLATNLNYLYEVGGLNEIATERLDRWWVDACFLALDRLIEDRLIDRQSTGESEYSRLLVSSGFLELSGPTSTQKRLALDHLVALYKACGSRDRFLDEVVEQKTLSLSDVAWLVANDTRPVAAVHPSDPNIFKSIPRACAILAVYAGFDVIYADDIDSFDPAEFVRRHTKTALERLRSTKIRPRMSAEELRKITREQ